MNCKKENASGINNVPEQDSMKFIFSYKDVDNTKVVAINLKSFFYNINNDSSSIFNKVYDLKSDPSEDSYLRDSIVHATYPVTIGCKKRFEITVLLQLPEFHEHQERYLKFYTIEEKNIGEEITSPEHFIEHFKWPDDTLDYIKVADYYRDF